MSSLTARQYRIINGRPRRTDRDHRARQRETAFLIVLISMVAVLLLAIYFNSRHHTSGSGVDRMTELTDRIAVQGITIRPDTDMDALVKSACSVTAAQMPFFVGKMVDDGTSLVLPGDIIEIFCPSHLGNWREAVGT